MSNEEYIIAIKKLLEKMKNNNKLLERIYSYLNKLYVGRGRD